MSSLKDVLSFSFFIGRDWSDGSGDSRWRNFGDGEPKMKGSVISSSGLVQLPPSEGIDSKLSLEETDESEKPPEDVGRLEVSLWLEWPMSDQCWGPSKWLRLPIWATGVFGGESMRPKASPGER